MAHAATGVYNIPLEKVMEFMESIYKDVSQNETVILSSEPIYRHIFGYDVWMLSDLNLYWKARYKYLNHLAKILRHRFDVTVVLYLRRQDSFAESLYSEAVLRGFYNDSFQKFCSDWHVVFDYSAQIKAFKSAFERVEVYKYEDANQTGIVPYFFKNLKLEHKITMHDIRMRVSPDARFILWLLTQDLSKRNMQRNFILSDHAKNLFSDSKSMGFWKSINERDTFLDRFDGEYNRYFFGPPPLEIKEPAQINSFEMIDITNAYYNWERSYNANK